MRAGATIDSIKDKGRNTLGCIHGRYPASRTLNADDGASSRNLPEFHEWFTRPISACHPRGGPSIWQEARISALTVSALAFGERSISAITGSNRFISSAP